jgi:hypothetical protein
VIKLVYFIFSVLYIVIRMALIEAYEDQCVPTSARPRDVKETSGRAKRAAPGAPLISCSPALSWRRYQGLIKDVNAKIDRLKNLSASAANDQDAWNSTVAAVRRDVEDADEVLGKFAMETRRFALLRTRSVCSR